MLYPPAVISFLCATLFPRAHMLCASVLLVGLVVPRLPRLCSAPPRSFELVRMLGGPAPDEAEQQQATELGFSEKLAQSIKDSWVDRGHFTLRVR